MSWEIHKFGGTSLAHAQRYRNAAQRLREAGEGPQLAVVSSMAGVTDGLLELLDEEEASADLAGLTGRHREAARELLRGPALERFEAQLQRDADDISQVLRACRLIRGASEATRAWLVAFGELWSARLLCGLLQAEGHASHWLDARTFLTVSHGESAIEVEWERSREALGELLDQHPCEYLVVTGFIASLPDGTPTTLRRDGSDLSASIVGALLGAKALTIWTDVDGVFSADPRRVPEAELLQQMSWQEATELAYFGANVLHPHAMAPAMRHDIPITIRNSLRPEVPGTRIRAKGQTQASPGRSVVKGFSTIDDMALLNVEGAGMMGVPGVASRLFGALREVGVSVVMISQASSEHSICFAVPSHQAERAREVVQSAFFRECSQGLIQKIESVSPCSILAAVGDAMVETPGVAARFFDALGKAGVNVRAIAQGSSERNISAVIDQSDSSRALRAVHSGFYLSQQTLSVGLVGPGLIGAALLEQLHAQADILRSQFHIDLRVRGIANSRKMLLHELGLPLESWRARFEAEAVDVDLEAFAAHIKTEHLPHSAIVDCTASPLASQWVPAWLERGIHVITPNKKAFSSQFEVYQRLRQTARRRHVHAFYEATVGAGLPIISTLRDLLQSGDQILQIEGIFSGTLSYLFNTLTPQMHFSKLVGQAKAQGYTEPDPRDDLSGMDVARKLVILAREMGLSLELEDLEVHSLVPEALREVEEVDAFLEQLAEYDGAMGARLQQAQERGEVLRYVGAIDHTGEAPTARVSLRSYGQDHAFGRLRGSDNIIAFRTRRYDHQPLIVQGPGAGPEVTAGGVFADLLRLAAHLGAPS